MARYGLERARLGPGVVRAIYRGCRRLTWAAEDYIRAEEGYVCAGAELDMDWRRPDVCWRGLDVDWSGLHVDWRGLDVGLIGLEVNWGGLGMGCRGLDMVCRGLKVGCKNRTAEGWIGTEEG